MKITIEIKDEDLKKLMLLLGKSDIEILGIGERGIISYPTPTPMSIPNYKDDFTITCKDKSILDLDKFVY